MKLYYFREAANFGDALNTWLWPRLLPGLLDEDARSIFVGIGTLLNTHVPAEPHKVVFGAGVGYGAGAPTLDDRWSIYCVRGPLSARALGVDPSLAITDAAALLRTIYAVPYQAHLGVSFMPHWQSSLAWDWATVCRTAGLHYIDPLGPVDQVLAEISGSELVLAEAMHGAIVADALRVPWVPVRLYDQVLEFKWRDWCQSVGLDYTPALMPALHSTPSFLRKWVRSLPHQQQAWADSALFGGAPLSASAQRLLVAIIEPWRRRTLSRNFEQVVNALGETAQASRAVLSTDATIERLTARLRERLDQLIVDVRSGQLEPDRGLQSALSATL